MKDDQYSFIIKHFKNENSEQKGLFRPSLGRMNLAQSLPRNDHMDKIMKLVKSVGFSAPMWLFPGMAFAANAVPPGFEDFNYVSSGDSGPFQFLIEFNKSFIILIEQTLHNGGMEHGSAGLAIVIWASILKLLTTPLYYNTLKFPT